MRTSLVVPDASVILKWVLPVDDELDIDRAVELREAIVNNEVRAIVPPLWIYEVGNTVSRRFPSHAAVWLKALVNFGLEEATHSLKWIDKAVTLANDHGVTFYDAAYHAVAIVYGGVFVTADAQYVERAKGAGSIVALDNWKQT